jgi:hypothetical protein
MPTLTKRKPKDIGDFYLHVPSSYSILGVNPLSFLTELTQNVGIEHFHYKTLKHQILLVTVEDKITTPMIISLAKEYIFLMSVIIMQALRNEIDLSCLGLATLTLNFDNPKTSAIALYFHRTLDVIKTVDMVNRIISKRFAMRGEEEDE